MHVQNLQRDEAKGIAIIYICPVFCFRLSTHTINLWIMSEKTSYLNQNMIKLIAKRRVDFKRRACAMRVFESSYSYINAKGSFWSPLQLIFYSSEIKSSSSNKTWHFFSPLVCLCLLRSDIGNSLSSPPDYYFTVRSCSESKLTVTIGIYMIFLSRSPIFITFGQSVHEKRQSIWTKTNF